jgi:hypothetical protein
MQKQHKAVTLMHRDLVKHASDLSREAHKQLQLTNQMKIAIERYFQSLKDM